MSDSNPTLAAAPNGQVVRVFVSYAREDLRWFDANYRFNLVPYLTESLRRSNVVVWYDNAIVGGDEFRPAIKFEIDRAHIVVLIVSQHFLNSDFIESIEMPRIAARAQRGELVVVPVLVEPCGWHDYSFLADRQMVPSSSPLIHFTESEAKWADVRFQILDGLQTQVKRVREKMQTEALRRETEELLKREKELEELRQKEEAEERERRLREHEEKRKLKSRPRPQDDEELRKEAEKREQELEAQRQKDEADRKTREETERQEASRIEAERAEAARIEAERQAAQAEALRTEVEERRKREQEAIEKQQIEDALRKSREEAERKAAEDKAREESARKAREDTARKAREEAERKALEEKKRKKSDPSLILWNPRLFFSICAIVCFALLIDVAYHHWFGQAGARWTALKSGTTDNLYSLAGSSDAGALYSCGAGKTFLVSTDDGATWENRNSAISANCDSIFSTADGKQIWTPASNATITATTRLFLTSVILASSDGGTNWQSEYLTSLFDYLSDKPVVPLKTFDLLSNLGDSSTSTSSLSSTIPTRITIDLIGIFGTPDGKHLWAAGDKGEIYSSENSGSVWGSQTSATKADLKAISGTSDGNFLMAVGEDGVTVASLNGGEAWQEHDSGSKFDLRAIFISTGAKLLCAVGDVGAVRISTDKGATWTAGDAGAGGSFHGIFGTPDGKHLWTVGTSGIIIQSDDSGVTWKLRSSGVKSSLNAIFGTPDGKHLWAVGDNGTILESKSSVW